MENWLDVKGYEHTYQISNLGRLKNKKKDLILSPPITPKGYIRASLYKNKRSKNYMVHRLVAVAFIPNHGNEPYIKYKNGIKSDNNSTNL